MSTTDKLDLWAIVELFGHAKIAGRCTEQNIAGGNMLRVDVPETEKDPAFTRFFGSAAIYSINPVDEKIARAAAVSIRSAPIDSYSMAEYMRKRDIENTPNRFITVSSRINDEPLTPAHREVDDNDRDDFF